MNNPINNTYFADANEKFDPTIVVDSLFSHLSPRECEVIRRRHGIGESKSTLEAIGQDLGVTRERVRQIEIGSIKKLKRLDEFSRKIKEARDILTEMIKGHGGIMEELFLIDNLNLVRKDEQVKGATLFILSKLLDDELEYVSNHEHILNSWRLKQVDETEFIDRIDKLIKLIESHQEPIEEDRLYNRYQEHYGQEEELLKCPKVFRSHLRLARQIDQNVFGLWGIYNWNTIRPKRMNDKIYIVLKKQGQPLHFSDIAKLINEMRFDSKTAYPATVHNELILDKKYVLVGRGIYALSEWGYKHGVVADVIKYVLRERPGLKRDEIVDQVLKQRLVGKSTIHLSLMDKKNFKKDAEGRYFVVGD